MNFRSTPSFEKLSPQDLLDLVAAYDAKDYAPLTITDRVLVLGALGYLKADIIGSDGKPLYTATRRPFPWPDRDMEIAKNIFASWPVIDEWEQAKEEITEKAATILASELAQIRGDTSMTDVEKGEQLIVAATSALAAGAREFVPLPETTVNIARTSRIGHDWNKFLSFFFRSVGSHKKAHAIWKKRISAAHYDPKSDQYYFNSSILFDPAFTGFYIGNQPPAFYELDRLAKGAVVALHEAIHRLEYQSIKGFENPVGDWKRRHAYSMITLFYAYITRQPFELHAVHPLEKTANAMSMAIYQPATKRAALLAP